MIKNKKIKIIIGMAFHISAKEGMVNNELENILEIILNACSTLFARKKIQAKTVKQNVMPSDKNSLTVGKYFPCATISRLVLFVLNIIEGMI